MYQGETLKLVALDNHLAELHFDATGKSVNVFNEQTIKELSAALDILESASEIKGLLITSRKKVFIAGADITEFGPVFAQSKDTVRAYLAMNNRNLNRLEDLPFPTVVAINGFALGGGFELCLACDFRVMSTVAKVGFPEVQLGIIPGWGGTVRAPRLAGVQAAVEWIASGRQNGAEQAAAVSLADEVAAPDDLLTTAFTVLNEAIAGTRSYVSRRLAKTLPLAVDEQTMSSLRAAVSQKTGPHYPAPVAAVDSITTSALLPRDKALEMEFETFYAMAMTSQSRALIGNFVADQKINSIARTFAAQAGTPVGKVAVLGAGVMGGGIAYQNAISGVPVVMKDISQQALDLGMAEVKRLLQGQVKKGRLNEEKAEAVAALITPTLDYSGFSDCDLVIEAVVEKESIKKAVLAEVEKVVPETSILASNTSSILISSIAEALQRPQNFSGIHFFNPVHAMPLVEVIRGAETSEHTLARSVAHVAAMRKKPVVVNDCPGFLVNRVLFPYFAGFNLLMRDGADFHAVDQVMEGWGWPMGPAYLLDVIGMDVAVHAADVLAAGFPERMDFDFPQTTEQLLSLGRLGQKSGAGYYRYVEGSKGRKEKQQDPETERLLADIVAPRREFTEDEIIARMMIPLCTELARCLEEGIVASPEEADIALLYGLGFPAFRGGALRWLDEIGLSTFVGMAEPYQALGELYQPTAGMQQKCARGEKYYRH